jgi:predicted MFS family arabinose efflux permease
MMITMGVRQSLGLFIPILHQDTGLSVTSISLALAIGQFVWGASQPIFGILESYFGLLRVLFLGTILLFLGLILTPFCKNTWQLIVTLGLLVAAGAGAGSFTLLIGGTVHIIPAHLRSIFSGFLNAGGSLGQFVFAPMSYLIITYFNWITAIVTIAGISLVIFPLSYILNKYNTSVAQDKSSDSADPLFVVIKNSFKNSNYILLHIGFFTCGFHIAFLATHLPNEVKLCNLSSNVASNSLAIIGLANIIGSLTFGSLGSFFKMKNLLFFAYFTRALAILIYLFSPKEPWIFYVFAITLGFTWLSTVPPTAGLVGKFFGTKHLSLLFGLTLLTHQVGAFFGAWLGGYAFDFWGNYDQMWYADICLALIAAIINLPIKEAPPVQGLINILKA